MIWTIHYSAEARQDLRDIREYISDELMAPTGAANQVRKIMDTIRRLEEMPMHHRLYEDEPWYSQGLRFLPVGNYLVFYIPDEVSTTVKIIRIIVAPLSA
ncbi:MAG: type II toxin-antitoxin system RelE/ParE family toxin [Firmicutes bacterium]|nr:type II toxin-antitoxin system RelE/ParE family toxin [Bacillota bacterium]